MNKIKNDLIKIIKRSHNALVLAAALVSFPSYVMIKGRSKNTIQMKGAFIKNSQIRIKGKNNLIKIMPENRLFHCVIHISGNHCEIQVEKHCILQNLELWIEDDWGKIVIGNRTTAEGGHIAATEGESIFIGEDCMFSHGIEIRNGDSHAIVDYNSKVRINGAQPIKIGSHVWLCSDAKVLKGSYIEDGAIIATGAIVTGNVPHHTIYGGIPAKKIKDNIDWERKRLGK